MRYLPYAAASSEPNVIVDGMANDCTLITLSHWRRSGTPSDLMADTSTGIVFNYLDRPDLHVPPDVVSNNHFHEDGLVGIYALLEPDAAASRRDLLIDVAQAGDFGVFRSRRAARITFAISAHADRTGRSSATSWRDAPVCAMSVDMRIGLSWRTAAVIGYPEGPCPRRLCRNSSSGRRGGRP